MGVFDRGIIDNIFQECVSQTAEKTNDIFGAKQDQKQTDLCLELRIKPIHDGLIFQNSIYRKTNWIICFQTQIEPKIIGIIFRIPKQN